MGAGISLLDWERIDLRNERIKDLQEKRRHCICFLNETLKQIMARTVKNNDIAMQGSIESIET